MTIRKKLLGILAAIGLATCALVAATGPATAAPGEQAASSTAASGQELAAKRNCPGGQKLTQRPIWNNAHTREIGRVKVFYKEVNGRGRNCVQSNAFFPNEYHYVCMDVRNDGRKSFCEAESVGSRRVSTGFHKAHNRCIKWSAFIGGSIAARTGSQHSEWRFCGALA